MAGLPKKCPACSEEMRVRVLGCPHCSTEIQGDFPLGRFERLSGEQLDFLETFIRCRGSLKDVCGEIGISYPTARNRLDALIAAMGFSEEKAQSVRRVEILEQVKEGIISVEEALQMLKS